MLDNLNFNPKKIISIIAIIIAIIGMYFIYNKKQKNVDIITEENILIKENVTEKNEESNQENIIIHITGAVRTPGIVKLPEGSRIEDAINAAGGLTENADISNVNLAYVLEDGIKIKIPNSTEIGDITENEIITEGIGEILEEETSSIKNTGININKASESELKTLPGIGSSLATKIVEYRNENGKFSNIQDIKNVNGIGENKYQEIKDYIKVK